MTRREKTLSFLLLPPMALLAGGFIAYQLWYSPLQAKNRQIEEMGREIEEKVAAVRKANDKKKELDKFNLMSLPRELELARREYEEQLSKLVRTSGFDAQSITITSKKPDPRSAPTLAKGQPPIYTRLEYVVQAKGELLSLVEFMEKFYDIRLLHQIRNIKVQRPSAADRGRPTYELDFFMTIDALVLDRAEQRKTLISEKLPELPPVLAAGERKYSAIAGRDLFYGPPPPAPVVRQERPTSSADFAQFVKFDGYTESDRGPVATLWDTYNSNEQTIRPGLDGDGYRVEVKYLLNGRKRTLRSGKTIDVLDENGELQHRWLVLKLTEREVFLQDEESYYVVRIGQWLSEMTRLTVEEAAAQGLISAKGKDAGKPEEAEKKEEKPTPVEKGD